MADYILRKTSFEKLEVDDDIYNLADGMFYVIISIDYETETMEAQAEQDGQYGDPVILDKDDYHLMKAIPSIDTISNVLVGLQLRVDDILEHESDTLKEEIWKAFETIRIALGNPLDSEYERNDEIQILGLDD